MACYFLCAVCSVCVGGSDEDPFRSDFRTISHGELVEGSDVFYAGPDGNGSGGSGGHYSRLVVDPARSQLVAGGRDAIVRLQLDGLRRLETAAWPATPESVDACLLKGQREDDCRNYIKVTHSHTQQ